MCFYGNSFSLLNDGFLLNFFNREYSGHRQLCIAETSIPFAYLTVSIRTRERRSCSHRLPVANCYHRYLTWGDIVCEAYCAVFCLLGFLGVWFRLSLKNDWMGSRFKVCAFPRSSCPWLWLFEECAGVPILVVFFKVPMEVASCSHHWT